jgi:hypothetical protein
MSSKLTDLENTLMCIVCAGGDNMIQKLTDVLDSLPDAKGFLNKIRILPLAMYHLQRSNMSEETIEEFYTACELFVKYGANVDDGDVFDFCKPYCMPHPITTATKHLLLRYITLFTDFSNDISVVSKAFTDWFRVSYGTDENDEVTLQKRIEVAKYFLTILPKQAITKAFSSAVRWNTKLEIIKVLVDAGADLKTDVVIEIPFSSSLNVYPILAYAEKQCDSETCKFLKERTDHSDHIVNFVKRRKLPMDIMRELRVMLY